MTCTVGCRRKLKLVLMADPKTVAGATPTYVHPLGCCDNCVRDDIKVNLAFELCVLLLALREFDGDTITPPIIDLIRNSDTKRSSSLPSVLSVNNLKGLGTAHSYTWWFEFLYGPVYDADYICNIPSKPLNVKPTKTGLTFLSDNKFTHETTSSDMLKTFFTYQSIGMLPKVNPPTRKSAALTSVQKNIFTDATVFVRHLARTHKCRPFHVISDHNLEQIIRLDPPLSKLQLISHDLLSTDLFRDDEKAKENFIDNLLSTYEIHKAHTCEYVLPRKQVVCGNTAKTCVSNVWLCSACVSSYNKAKEREAKKAEDVKHQASIRGPRRRLRSQQNDCVCNTTYPRKFVLVCKGQYCIARRFHPMCLNMSVAQGRAIAQRNAEWFCPDCVSVELD